MATEAAPPRYEPDEWWVPTATDAAAARSDGAGDGRSEYGRAVSALARLQARRRAARSRELYGAHVAEGRAWAPFVATKMEVVREMLAFAVAGRADVVVDLGAGDGRIALCAAIERDVARARGIELDEKLVTRARAAAAKHGLDGGAGAPPPSPLPPAPDGGARETATAPPPPPARVSFEVGDWLADEVDLSDATVVTMFFVAHDAIGAALARKLQPGTRVVSYVYAVPGWTPVETRETLPHLTERGTSPLFLYKLPESAAPTPPATATSDGSTAASPTAPVTAPAELES